MARDNNPLTTYGLVAGVVGQVGCIVLLVILATILLGLALDEAFGTRPTFIFVMLLVSVPVNLAALFVYTRHKARQMHKAAKLKEEELRE